MDLNNYMAKGDRTLEQHTNDVRQRLQTLKKFEYVKDKRIYELTDKACFWHDFGKINREFQKRVKNTGIKFNDETEIAHNVLSIYFIDKNYFIENEDDYKRVVEAVLTHHDYCDEYSTICNKKTLIKELLKDFEDCTYKIKKGELNKIIEMINDKDTIMIKGLLHKCDYSASADIEIEYENDFLVNKISEAIKRWDSSLNSLQKFCLENTDNNIIVTAQTGMGKTEAGLLWLGNNKGFFVLPLKTAINAIYYRIRNQILLDEKIDMRVGLLHSDTLSEYSKNSIYNKNENSKIDYYTKTRQLSMPITVTTLDQIFDFVFKYPGYEMKLATLSYSKVIIDEIQMYGPDLLAYLTYGIHMISKFGGKVAILTATLSPFVRDILKEKGFCSGDIGEKSFTNDLKRHNVKVYNTKINTEIIKEKFDENEEKDISNKILVVCNTVKKAQKIYDELSENIDEQYLNIIHNKFIKKDRNYKEKNILLFGKTYEDEKNTVIDKKSCIWIATSIVEASLDIDFDYLFTELSDLNGLLQRMGRCNRKGIKEVSSYNCYVFTEIDEGIIRKKEKGFIDQTIYQLSKDALKNVDGILSENDKMDLIEEYFTTEKLAKSRYMIEFNEVYNFIAELQPNEVDKNNAKIRNILSYNVIPEKVYEDNKDDINAKTERLKDRNIELLEKAKIIDQIKEYTLSVEPWILKQSKKTAQLKLNRYEQIDVIDCNYDEKGFTVKKDDGFCVY